MKRILLPVLFFGFHFLAYCQRADDEKITADMFDMSLEELMNIEVTVASTQALSTRESPGVVSLITSDEIASLGARDLIDILRLVPGFEFGVDVQGVIGVGLRGNWGHEGKILILLDGQEMNERNFATTQLGNHFSVDQIDRIEIIRGPGSATYGGYAELGVINIITKKGDQLNGVQLNGSYGQLIETHARREAGLMIGKSSKDYAFDAKLLVSDGNRSDRDYTDFYGNTYSMKDNSSLNNLMVNIGGTYKGLTMRMIYEDYGVQQRDLFGESMPEPVDMHFESFYTELRYDFKVNNKLTITPKFQYKDQQPWRSNDNIALRLDTTDIVDDGELVEDYYGGIFSNKHVRHTLGGLNINSDLSEKVNLLGGVQYYIDNGETVENYEYSITGSQKVDFTNFSAYAQGLFKLDFAILTLGARYNNHEQFGSSFVPRIGITKVFDRFHAKLLMSQAFRAPSIENIDINFDIKPETTTVFELEAGYQLTSDMFLTANYYTINIENPIVYFFDSDTGDEGYLNFDKTGTNGLEVEYKYKPRWGTISLNYSNYSAGGKNKVESYALTGNNNRLVGLPQHKLNLYSTIKLSDKLTVSPSFTFLDGRSGYDIGEVQKDYGQSLFANIYFMYKNLLVEGLDVGAGVYNISDDSYAYIQPYNSGHTPLPSSGREIIFKLKYTLGF